MLAVDREAAQRQGYVDDDTWQHALDAGWTDRQLLEAFADTVRTILTNYLNHFLGTELDLPPSRPGQRVTTTPPRRLRRPRNGHAAGSRHPHLMDRTVGPPDARRRQREVVEAVVELLVTASVPARW